MSNKYRGATSTIAEMLIGSALIFGSKILSFVISRLQKEMKETGL